MRGARVRSREVEAHVGHSRLEWVSMAAPPSFLSWPNECEELRIVIEITMRTAITLLGV